MLRATFSSVAGVRLAFVVLEREREVSLSTFNCLSSRSRPAALITPILSRTLFLFSALNEPRFRRIGVVEVCHWKWSFAARVVLRVPRVSRWFRAENQRPDSRDTYHGPTLSTQVEPRTDIALPLVVRDDPNSQRVCRPPDARPDIRQVNSVESLRKEWASSHERREIENASSCREGREGTCESIELIGLRSVSHSTRVSPSTLRQEASV